MISDEREFCRHLMYAVSLAYGASQLTLQQLGIRMGYHGDTARKGAHQFLFKTNDPRISTLRKFCRATNVPITFLLKEAEVLLEASS